MRRLPVGGVIDRNAPLRFRFNGVDLTGLAGDTLASALLANGVDVVGPSPVLGRPRGVMTAGPEEPCAIVSIDAPWTDVIQPATTRRRLWRALQMVRGKKLENRWKKHDNIPL